MSNKIKWTALDDSNPNRPGEERVRWVSDQNGHNPELPGHEIAAIYHYNGSGKSAFGGHEKWPAVTTRLTFPAGRVDLRDAFVEQLKTSVENFFGPAPVALEVSAYVPKGETHPVLLVTIQGVAVGFAFRRGEFGYDHLKKACDGQPKWMFGQSPSPLE